MKILSAEQIRQWDEYTIQHEPVTSLNLMERAALKCTEWIVAQKFDKRVKIFCGKGNNGGDGLAIARQLAERNIVPEIFIIDFHTKGTPDFEDNLAGLETANIPVNYIQHPDFFPTLSADDVVIEALFGSGLNRALEGLPAELVQHIYASKSVVVSIDIPAGLLCDKPTSSEAVIKAHHTLTFQILKLCFLYPENEQFAGTVHVLDIGLHPAYLATITSGFELADRALVRQIYKPRKAFSHKGTFGHSLIFAGAKGKMGAAVLCSTACLRSGAGLVSCMLPADQFQIVQTALPEAMAVPHEGIEELEWSKYSSIGIGPGIGTGEEGAGLLQKVLSFFNKPIVVDADALTILSTNKELLKDLQPGSILSPHPKEFERLFGKTSNQAEKIQTARYYAQTLFVYIILKGHYSMLACPDGAVFFNSTGNAGMATGGSGDVLTGILAGLLAQGYSSKDCCLLGMFLHGLAADIAVETLSQEALISGDIVNYLGKAFLSLSA